MRMPKCLFAALILGLWAAGSARPAAAETLEPFVTKGAPRTFQVVVVPLPDDLTNDIEVVADVIPIGNFLVLPPTRKVISPSQHARRIAITIAIPSRAPAGRSRAVEIHFHVRNGRELTLPVDVEVGVVRQIILRSSAVALIAQRGGVASIPYTVANEGNITEAVTIALLTPNGWPAHQGGQIVVRPGETLDQQLRLRIPEKSATGSVFLAMNLKGGGQVRSTCQVALEILDATLPAVGTGPDLGSSLSRVSEGVERGTLLDISLKGPVFDSISVDGRFAHAPVMTGSASQALSRLGMYQGLSYLVLSSPSSKLGLGATGTSLSDLTGKYLYGQGMLYETRQVGWSLTAFGASSTHTQEARETRPLLGLRGEMQAGAVRLSSSVSHLTESEPSERSLNAIGVGASAPFIYRSLFSTEVARRSYTGGIGYGWMAAVERNETPNSLHVAVTHAPGGSEAFARSTDEATGNFSQQLTRHASISGAAWRVSDPNREFSSVRSDGWSVRPEYRVFSSTTMAVEAGSYGFEAVHRDSLISANAFGSREDHVGVSVSSSAGPIQLTSSVAFAEVNRSITTRAQGTVDDRAPKIAWSGLVYWAGDLGALQLHETLDESRDRVGIVHRQGVIGVRADQIRVPAPLAGIRLNAEAERLVGYERGSAYTLRAGLAVPLVDRLNMKLSVERNSLLQSISSVQQWIFAARFEHALRMKMLRVPATTGHVYRDLNGNGHHDTGEPGVGNALVRRGRSTAVTDAEGRYRLAGDTNERVAVDDASIPDGWIVEKNTGSDIGLSARASAAVDLVILSGSAASPPVDLAPARVLARDGEGHQWVARMSGPTTATFDALPVGEYEITFDLSDLSEPLTPHDQAPRLRVVSDSRTTITVQLEPRPLKLWTPGSRSPVEAAPNTAPRSAQQQVPPGDHRQ
jgi:hypothetical protein